MRVRIVISGDEKAGFTWQLVDVAKVVKAGHTDTQARAVVAGQDALIEYKRKRRWDRAWSASNTPIVSSRAKR